MLGIQSAVGFETRSSDVDIEIVSQGSERQGSVGFGNLSSDLSLLAVAESLGLRDRSGLMTFPST